VPHTAERIAPLPLESSISDALLKHFTTETAHALEAADNGWRHSPAISHSGHLYLLIQYQRGQWTGKRTFLIVNYQLLDIGAGRRELRFSSWPEHQASQEMVHACPLTLLERGSPTRDVTARAWRTRCWTTLQDHAARSAPQDRWNLSLPLALCLSETSTIMRIHAGHLYLLSWQGPVPRYGESMHGIVHIQQAVHMGGIADPESVVPVKGLDEAIDVFLEQGVPLSTGWFSL